MHSARIAADKICREKSYSVELIPCMVLGITFKFQLFSLVVFDAASSNHCLPPFAFHPISFHVFYSLNAGYLSLSFSVFILHISLQSQFLKTKDKSDNVSLKNQ